MDKAQSFRDHITAHVPELKKNPEKLNVFLEKGNIVARLSSLNWEYRYEINILVTDFSGHPDELFLPLLSWVAVHQPSLMQNPDLAESAIKFEAEPLDHEKYDISITLPVTEAVRVTQDGEQYNLEHLPEPDLADLTGPTPWTLVIRHMPQH